MEHHRVGAPCCGGVNAAGESVAARLPGGCLGWGDQQPSHAGGPPGRQIMALR